MLNLINDCLIGKRKVCTEMNLNFKLQESNNAKYIYCKQIVSQKNAKRVINFK